MDSNVNANGGNSTSHVVITPESLNTAYLTIEQAATEIGKALDVVKASIDDVQSAWQDAQGTAYMNKFNELYPQFANFKESAHGFGNFLKVVADAYLKYSEEASAAVGK